ncbi:MAG: hypothetical protein QOJ15_1332 [Bradyrhizobium sp.]|jgi:hypothetical protein|nr:hypothetical protein [Bradyrhizobium sp.]
MPLAVLVQPQSDRDGSNRRPIGLVTCPNCQVVMPRISLQPSDAENLYEAVHRCPKCETKTRRWIKL